MRLRLRAQYAQHAIFTKAGEVQVAANYGLTGTDFQGAVAVSNHFALMANYSYSNILDSVFSGSYLRDNLDYRFYEGAIGYYRNIDSDNNVRFEIFVGYGHGSGFSYEDSEHDLTMSVLRLPENITAFSFSLRLHGKFAGLILFLAPGSQMLTC